MDVIWWSIVTWKSSYKRKTDDNATLFSSPSSPSFRLLSIFAYAINVATRKPSLIITMQRRRLDTSRYDHKCQHKIIIKICYRNFNYGLSRTLFLSCYQMDGMSEWIKRRVKRNFLIWFFWFKLSTISQNLRYRRKWKTFSMNFPNLKVLWNENPFEGVITVKNIFATNNFSLVVIIHILWFTFSSRGCL